MSTQTGGRRPNLEELPPHVPMMFTPYQLMEAIARGAGKTIGAYHERFHTAWWKRALMRLAAEVESFKSAVNEKYGPMHAREELWWQRAVRWVSAVPSRIRGAFTRIRRESDEEEALKREVERIDGEPKVKHIDKRAGRG